MKKVDSIPDINPGHKAERYDKLCKDFLSSGFEMAVFTEDELAALFPEHVRFLGGKKVCNVTVIGTGARYAIYRRNYPCVVKQRGNDLYFKREEKEHQ